MLRPLTLSRYTIAFVGASVITLGMFYGMAKIAELFERRDPTQYFRITDVLLQPEGTRPRRPPRAAEQPVTGPVEFDRPDVSLDVEQPSVEIERSGNAPVTRPRLEGPGSEPTPGTTGAGSPPSQ